VLLWGLLSKFLSVGEFEEGGGVELLVGTDLMYTLPNAPNARVGCTTIVRLAAAAAAALVAFVATRIILSELPSVLLSVPVPPPPPPPPPLLLLWTWPYLEVAD
jgi:hypothetical protein